MPTSRSDTSTTRLLTVISTTLVVLTLYVAKEILLPIALAIFLSFLLTPLIRRLERHGMARVPAVLITAVFAFTALGLTGWLVTNQIIDLSEKLPGYRGNLISKVRSISGAAQGKIGKATETIKEIGVELTQEDRDKTEITLKGESNYNGQSQERTGLWDYLLQEEASRAGKIGTDEAVAVKVVALPPSPLEQLQTWLGPLVSPLTTAGIVVVLVLFLSIYREDMRNRFLQLVGTTHLRTTTEALDQATHRVMRLLRMQLLANTIYGVAVGTGLYLIGIPNAFLWGVLGVVLRFLPFVGPWIVAAMPLTLSMAVFDDWSHSLLALGLFVIVELTLNNAVEPLLYSKDTGMSTVGIIIAAIFWTWFWGPVGLLIAMPLTVCLVIAGTYVPQMRYLTILLGDRSTLPLEEQFYQRLLALDDEEADHLAELYLHENSRQELYENLLIPSLLLGERDRHHGLLSQKQEQMVIETTQELVEEFEEDEMTASDAAETSTTLPALPNKRVLCVPGNDKADEITSIMLSQLLESKGIPTETRTTDSLAAELVEYLEEDNADILVITALPPRASRHARYLCKRIRAVKPDLPIVICLWNGSELTRTLKRLDRAGATSYVHTLDEAVEEIVAQCQRAAAPKAVDAISS